MSTADYDFPAGPLTRFRRGLVVGLGAWVAAFMVVALPCIAAWFANASAGVHISSAVRSAAIATAAGNLGGVRLNGVAVSLPPGLVTVLLIAVLVQATRRVDGRSGHVGLAVGYSIAAALGGGVRLGTTYAPHLATLGAALALSLVTGAACLYGPGLADRVSDRWYAVARAALAAVVGLVAAGAVAVGASLAMHLNTAADLQRDLATGGAGLPVLLLGLAAVPNAVVAGIGVLSGATVSLGGHTTVSVWSVHNGRLPAFPLLAAVPQKSLSIGVSLGLVAITALFVGRLVDRGLAIDGPVTDGVLDRLAAAALAGLATAVATGLLAGGLGSRSLAHIGGSWWQTGVCVALVSLVGTLFWFGLDVLRGSWHHRADSDSGTRSQGSTADERHVLTRK